MEIIEEVEPVRRASMAGQVLYADFAETWIRALPSATMLMKGKKAYVQAGAGIVADSIPESEYQECLNKTRALVRAVELARSGE